MSIPKWVTVIDLEDHNKSLRIIDELNSAQLTEVVVEMFDGEMYRFPEKLCYLKDTDSLYIKESDFLQTIPNHHIVSAVKEREDKVIVELMAWNDETSRNELLGDEMIKVTK